MKVCLDVNLDGVTASIAKSGSSLTGLASDSVPKVEPKVLIKGGAFYVNNQLIYRQVLNSYAKFMMVNTGVIEGCGGR